MSGRNNNLCEAPIFQQKTVAELTALSSAYVASDPDTVRIGQAYICTDEGTNPYCLCIFDGTSFKVAYDGTVAA